MSSKNIRTRGRPSVDSERVDTRLPRDTLDAIDKFAAEKSGQRRTDAIRRILRDWLIGAGYLKPEPDE